MIAGDLLGERARLTPDKLALVDVTTGARLSYRALDERARRAARTLTHALGLGPGDRLALLSHNRLEFIDLFFAAGKTGVILVPLSTRATARELAGVVRDALPKALVFENALSAVALDLIAQEPVPKAVSLDAGGDLGVLGWEELARSCDGVEQVNARCQPDDLWCLLYTSGTTGAPKGVMVPHRMVLWNGFDTVACWQLQESDISPIFTPLYHAGGLGAFLVPIVTIGGTLVLHRGFDPEEVWRTIERERATVVLGVPTIYKLLMESPSFGTVDLSSVRWLISGGAPLPVYVVEAYHARGVAFKQGFGMTEVGVNCFAMTLEDSRRKLGSIGKPLAFTEARIAGEDGRTVGPGTIGELRFRGPHVCAGYWRNPEATRAAFDEDGWFRSGDMARCDEDGFFYIAGRSKDMYISGGVNVYPAEVEAVLLQHPDVADAAIVGVADERWGEAGVAFLVMREGVLDEASVRAFLEERVARYKHPKALVAIAALPRTAYGKVVKPELARLWSERSRG